MRVTCLTGYASGTQLWRHKSPGHGSLVDPRVALLPARPIRSNSPLLRNQRRLLGNKTRPRTRREAHSPAMRVYDCCCSLPHGDEAWAGPRHSCTAQTRYLVFLASILVLSSPRVPRVGTALYDRGRPQETRTDSRPDAPTLCLWPKAAPSQAGIQEPRDSCVHRNDRVVTKDYGRLPECCSTSRLSFPRTRESTPWDGRRSTPSALVSATDRPAFDARSTG